MAKFITKKKSVYPVMKAGFIAYTRASLPTLAAIVIDTFKQKGTKRTKVTILCGN